MFKTHTCIYSLFLKYLLYDELLTTYLTFNTKDLCLPGIESHTVTPADMVTYIKIYHFSSPCIEIFTWIEPPLIEHFCYKTTFSLSQKWPFNTGLTVLVVFFLSKLIVVLQYLPVQQTQSLQGINYVNPQSLQFCWLGHVCTFDIYQGD